MNNSGNVQVFNRTALLDRVMDNEDLAKMIAEAYLDDIPNQIIELKKALEETDLPLIERQAHTIKGASSNIGGEVVQEFAAQMEMACGTKDITEIKSLMAELETSFAELEKILIEFKTS